MFSDLRGEADPVEIPEEARALRDLLDSPGWVILKRAIDAQWGPRAYGLRMRDVLSKIQGTERAAEIARAAEAIEATCKAVDEVIAWPTQRLRQIESRIDTRAFATHRRTP